MKNDHFDQEEAFHDNENRLFRKERKLLSNKDRSKYKKTDLDKKKNQPASLLKKFADHHRGKVLAIMADGILVESKDQLYTCSLRGALKKEQLRIKNLIAVGDFVLFEAQNDATGSISYVEERHSILSRAEQISRNKEQLIAVNVDQVLITTSVVSPSLKSNLIDRYILAALKGNMQPIIVINKIDLLEEDVEEKILFEKLLTIYHALEIPVCAVSTKTQEGIAELKNIMAHKTSVFSGQSGAGKTSLINLLTGSNFLTGQIVAKTGKGAHTTTTTYLLPVGEEGFCIDTPGIKSFGVWNVQEDEVQKYFFEINQKAKECKFPNCTHLHEPQCAVQEALQDGQISSLRFESYCALIASLKEKPKR